MDGPHLRRVHKDNTNMHEPCYGGLLCLRGHGQVAGTSGLAQQYTLVRTCVFKQNIFEVFHKHIGGGAFIQSPVGSRPHKVSAVSPEVRDQ